VTPDDERAARAALAASEMRNGLLVVHALAPRTSPILDFLLPGYGGPGAGNVLVVAPDRVGFYDAGAVVLALARPGAWWGGALPQRGFWGAPRRGGTSMRCRSKSWRLSRGLGD
jgi:hypothetical protein